MKIFSFICKKEKELEEQLDNIIKKLEDVEDKYKKERKQIENIFNGNFINNRDNLYNRIDVKIVGYSQNKNGHNVFILLYNNNEILLYNNFYNKIEVMPNLYFKRQDMYDKNSQKIGEKIKIIGLFAEKDKNIGNGSILLKALIKFAKEEKIKKITGELPRGNKANNDKQLRKHFYEKFGFKINEEQIELLLD
ncbi:GNAT family N-acetyltransferase [Pseudoleptotrichia goodfellowii]|uniref:N-acetyltransferase domain-containing protein n=1 Tax=Pseudoleptotrichia goodfellowii F0264 TaxID=596323 RepID=D0GPM7_9FUSO|nr:GNAT family N-acetyltransferase [Pseudoleptotrichia goodfellowii]EEY33965.1 hypothetical protein HMPREF0554_0061 [Pseudoleptotrichia goodfellowii F0264]MBF4805096.1 GNAT family N-acetyltransferase [Pseudoleptotrichia goodfellowii]